VFSFTFFQIVGQGCLPTSSSPKTELLFCSEIRSARCLGRPHRLY